MSNTTIDELAEALQEFAPPEKPVTRSPRDERVITGFEEIQRFITTKGWEPTSDPSKDILERILAARLKAIRKSTSLCELLDSIDHQGLLSDSTRAQVDSAELSPDDLLAALSDGEPAGDITRLEHVRPVETRQAPDEVANRKPCPDFHLYKDMFKQVTNELRDGQRSTKPFEASSEIITGGLYIIEGQIAFVANVGDVFINKNGHKDARLRVVYDNGTESNLLRRSLQKALTQDAAGRVILDPSAQRLFTSEVSEGDEASGTIYVLRSKSEHPAIAQHRDLLHKIGVTTGSVKRRIANASKDPTFLMADVEIVATYELYNINRQRLEQLLHRFFASAQLKVDIKDRFGQPINPREWFLVPVFVIHEAVERLKDGSITDYYYDATTASLRKFE